MTVRTVADAEQMMGVKTVAGSVTAPMTAVKTVAETEQVTAVETG